MLIPITPDIVESLERWQTRTGIAPSNLFKGIPLHERPKGMTARRVNLWLSEEVAIDYAYLIDFVLKRYEQIYASQLLNSLKTASEEIVGMANMVACFAPRPIPDGHEEITEDDLRELTELIQQSRTSPMKLKEKFHSWPPGLLVIDIHNWIEGTVHHAKPNYLAFVLDRYRQLVKAKPKEVKNIY